MPTLYNVAINTLENCSRYLFSLRSRSAAIAVMLCFIGGPLLMNLDPDGSEVYTDRDTPCFLTTCFGIVWMGRQRGASGSGAARGMAGGYCNQLITWMHLLVKIAKP